MKKNRLVFILCTLVIFTLFFCNVSLARENMSGTVIQLYRDAYFLDTDTGKWMKAVDRMYVTNGHILKTGPDASMTFVIDDHLIRLGPDTEIRLTDLTGENIGGGLFQIWKDTSIVIDIIRGSLYIKAKDLSPTDVFWIRKGLSVAETKGGEFSVKIKETEIGADSAKAKDFIKGYKDKKDLPQNYSVFEGEMSVVSVKGNVTLSVFDPERNIHENAVYVAGGQTSSVSFMYVK
jgi:hypothetical protein